MDQASFVADGDVIVTVHADIIKALFKSRSNETREITLPLQLAVKLWSWAVPQAAATGPWPLPQFGKAAGTDRRRGQDRRGSSDRASVKGR